MRRESRSADLPRESVLKIDKDCHVDSELEREYLRIIIIILSKYHLKVITVMATRTQHGRHYYIHIDPPVDPCTANRLQYLLGDDAKRVDYNQARINSGLPEWNKLFERIGTGMRTVYCGIDRVVK
jgi:hypothetical protein